MASLSEPRAKLVRAAEHLQAFDDAMQTFLEPYLNYTRIEFDDKTGEEVTVFDGEIQDTPIKIRLFIGDSLQNICSALDYLVWQLVLAEGGNPTFKNAFPICESEGRFREEMGKRLHGVGAIAKERIEKLKPYKGGDTFLYLLNYLTNVDKHRHLSVTVMSLQYVAYGASDPSVFDNTQIQLLVFYQFTQLMGAATQWFL
jgi:hypothetical protein